ncbi:hypothetical protein G9P44_004674 [Scheffersomyces stipitis]|nr:hypothetical protein G9P44_004674 [Scheffersomyces stipitis]
MLPYMRSKLIAHPLKLVQGQNLLSSKVIVPFRKFHNIASATIIRDKYSTLHNFYQAPKYPIVLCHGFSGFDKLTFLPRISASEKAVEVAKNNLEKLLNEGVQLDYWHGIKEALGNIGSKVLIAKVPPFGRIEHRARTLEQYIIQQCDILRKQESKSTIYRHLDLQDGHSSDRFHTFNEINEPIKVNMISHSMGGLDSRYLISKLQKEDSPKPYKVVSLTTIATPHHGSECADFVENLVGNSKILRSMCPEAIFELTTSYAKKFNDEVVDDPSVKYFSYGAKFDPRWFSLFNLTWHMLRYEVQKNRNITDPVKKFDTRMDNDGMVSVESSMWGEYLGTLDQVDHLDLINWTNRLRVAIDKLILNKEPHFNAIALYLDIANNLSKRGF